MGTPAQPSRPPLPMGEGCPEGGVRDTIRLSAIKGDICDALWPTYGGCMYGRSCDAEKRIRLDAKLTELDEHFGERLVPLARELHAEMTKTGMGPPRTFLAHLQKLETRMIQELQSSPQPSANDVGGRAPGDYEPLLGIAEVFLGDIGFRKPPSIKLHSTIDVLASLESEGYSHDEIRLACALAVASGAHGPGLIPHMIGREVPGPDPVVAAASVHTAEHAQAERASHARWAGLADLFGALPDADRERYTNEAMRTNRTIAKRPADHPLVRAAAILLYAQQQESAGWQPALPGDDHA